MNKPLFILILTLSPVLAFAQNWMSLSPATALPGDTIALSLDITNADQFVAFQVDVLLPDTMIYMENTAQLSDRSVDHSLAVSLLEDNVLRFIAFSPGNTAFNGNEGEVLTFELAVGEVPGYYPLDLDEAILANSSSQNILDSLQNGWIEVAIPTGLVTPFRNLNAVVEVFPNPVSTLSELSLQLYQEGEYGICLYDLLGRKLLSSGKEQNFGIGELPLSQIEPLLPQTLSGIYLLEIKGSSEAGNILIYKKIIVE